MPSRFISRTTSRPNGVSPPCFGAVERRVGPVERDVVRQRHVARAEVVVRAQRAERVLDRVAALHAEQRRRSCPARIARAHVAAVSASSSARDTSRSCGARCRSARAARARSRAAATRPFARTSRRPARRGCRPTRTARRRALLRAARGRSARASRAQVVRLDVARLRRCPRGCATAGRCGRRSPGRRAARAARAPCRAASRRPRGRWRPEPGRRAARRRRRVRARRRERRERASGGRGAGGGGGAPERGGDH